MKQCPFCAENIQAEALKCRFCGEMMQSVAKLREKTLIICRPAWRSYLGSLTIGVLLLPLFGLGLVFIGLAVIDRAGKKYTVTNQRVIVQRGLMAKNVDEVNIRDIRNINTRQQAFQRLMGFGDIMIGTAGTAGNEILVQGIFKPASFKESIIRNK